MFIPVRLTARYSGWSLPPSTASCFQNMQKYWSRGQRNHILDGVAHSQNVVLLIESLCCGVRKKAEPIEMLLGRSLIGGPRNHLLDMGEGVKIGQIHSPPRGVYKTGDETFLTFVKILWPLALNYDHPPYSAYILKIKITWSLFPFGS